MSVNSLSSKKDIVTSLPSLSKVPTSNWSATTNDIFDLVVFNWQFYLDANSDLRSNGILTEAQAKNHWQTSGIKEGRRSSPEFYIKDYLLLNPDVADYATTNHLNLNTAALEHYLGVGRIEGREKINPHVYGYNLGGSITGSNGDFTFGNEQVLFRTWGRYSGTVSEVWFRGKQFENNSDTGRLFQTAFTFDNGGECFNPTEGGMSTDVYFNGQNFVGKSQSQLKNISATNGVFTATTTPAYWLAPNQSHYCGTGQGGVPLAQDQITKTITMNYAGDSQIVKWQIDIDVKNAHSMMRSEALTGYHNSEFNKLYNYNKNTKNLDLTIPGHFNAAGTDLDENVRRYVPQVVATTDGNHALGIYGLNKKNQQTSNPNMAGYYNLIVPGGPTKWSVYFEYMNGVVSGKYTTDIYLVFGNLEEVRQRMNFLEEHLNPSVSAPVTPIVVAPPVITVQPPVAISPLPVVVIPPPVIVSPQPIVSVSPTKIEIYRMRNSNDYLITPYQSEGANANYNSEGSFSFFANADSGTKAIYRCNGAAGHFVSTVSNCEGQSVEGVLAYLSVSNNNAGTLRPIYRIRTSTGNHLISYYETEGAAYGCVSEGLIGYGL